MDDGSCLGEGAFSSLYYIAISPGGDLTIGRAESHTNVPRSRQQGPTGAICTEDQRKRIAEMMTGPGDSLLRVDEGNVDQSLTRAASDRDGGTVPDIIFYAHGNPPRMTMGQLLVFQCLMVHR
ncbi:hypothetical protein BX666DRAFT_1879341 [Dichotomocladium elegans]|nr:hypothetical protein BX666DRAFT_1879341 [Dichotomocladium elegans]